MDEARGTGNNVVHWPWLFQKEGSLLERRRRQWGELTVGSMLRFRREAPVKYCQILRAGTRTLGTGKCDCLDLGQETFYVTRVPPPEYLTR